MPASFLRGMPVGMACVGFTFFGGPVPVGELQYEELGRVVPLGRVGIPFHLILGVRDDQSVDELGSEVVSPDYARQQGYPESTFVALLLSHLFQSFLL